MTDINYSKTCYKVCMWIIIKSSLLRSYAIVLNDVYTQKIFHNHLAIAIQGVVTPIDAVVSAATGVTIVIGEKTP